MKRSSKKIFTRARAERRSGGAAIPTLSAAELSDVAGGITTKMPPAVYGDATYGDMRLIPKTPLMSL